MSLPVVIVGTGLAGYNLAKEFRKLDAQTQASVVDDRSASAVMHAQPSVIKRPIVEWTVGGQTQISVGFAREQWQIWLDSQMKA